jgi:hypothetical protein
MCDDAQMSDDAKPERVYVSHQALQYVLDNASLCDVGMSGEGWKSEQMQKYVDQLTEEVKR